MPKQPWIYNRFFDSLFIIAPPFVALLISMFLPKDGTVSLAWWVALVLCIDVSHVYTTLYRTYFDKNVIVNHSILLKAIPVLCFAIGVILCSFGQVYFWRVLAYLAVYHFIRQQYGFIRLYSKNAINQYAWLDTLCIYTATIFPIIYWHLSGLKNFNWFVDDDFYFIPFQNILPYLFVIYYLIIVAYLVKEIWVWVKNKYVNVPKNGVILGTLLSWYFGIVYFNSDLIFTLLNVVAHGIPYMALVWAWGRKTSIKQNNNSSYQLIFSLHGIILFIGIVLVLGYVEEGLWDAMVWNENKGFFSVFYQFGKYDFSVHLTWLIPLLSLPQIVHYVLDGFIWKIKKDNFAWSKIILEK